MTTSANEHERLRITELQGRGRATGVPHLLAPKLWRAAAVSGVQEQYSALCAVQVSSGSAD